MTGLELSILVLFITAYVLTATLFSIVGYLSAFKTGDPFMLQDVSPTLISIMTACIFISIMFIYVLIGNMIGQARKGDDNVY